MIWLFLSLFTAPSLGGFSEGPSGPRGEKGRQEPGLGPGTLSWNRQRETIKNMWVLAAGLPLPFLPPPLLPIPPQPISLSFLLCKDSGDWFPFR